MTDITRLAAALSERYTLDRELGAGGMATVYLARDLKHDRSVALKVLRPELAVVIGAERFLAEIKTTANLQHPHILPLHDSGQVDGTVFYVMPLVEGESLRERLTREKQLPVEDAVRLATEVASALDYAHRHGVIHRDIKPENILLHDGSALIADFGIALAASSTSSTRMTETGMSLGTPHYMSPEQAMGERSIDARSDVYSLGAVLYEMLTGDPPHTGSTVQAIVAKVLSEAPTAISRTRSMVPANVDAVAQKALAKTPADRFQSAAEFAAALANPAFTLPSAATAARGVVRSSVWNPVSIGASALAAILLGITLYGWLHLETVSRDTVSRHRIVLRRPSPEPLDVGYGVTFSPDGSTIVFPDTVGGSQRLWAKVRSEKDATPIAGTEGALGAAFSPDGKSLAFMTLGQLKRVPSSGGSAITLADSVNGSRPASTWLDNNTIAFVGAGYKLITVPAAGGAKQTVQLPTDSLAAPYLTAMTALPDSRGVLVTRCTSDNCLHSGVWAIDVKTHAAKLVMADAVKAWYVPTGHIVYARRDGAVFAARFDVKKLEVLGANVPVIDGVRIFRGVPDLAISSGGDLLYVTGGLGQSDAFQVAWVDREGKAVPVDYTWRMTPGFNDGLALSPDGTRLAVNIGGAQSMGDIWVKQLDKGPLTRLTVDGTQNFRPMWTHDGRYVTYMSDRKNSSYDLFKIRADGSGSPEQLVDLAKPIQEGFESPDGNWLVLRRGGLAGQVGGRDIVGIRPGPDTTPVPLIVQEKFDSKAVVLSPDGKWLAYESTESGKEEVYVRPFPNSGDGKFPVSAHGGLAPLWSHSGKELFYLNGAFEMVVATIRPGATFAVERETVLFPTVNTYFYSSNYRQFDISRDDRRFIMWRRVSSDGPQGVPVDLILVENWFSELKAKVGK